MIAHNWWQLRRQRRSRTLFWKGLLVRGKSETIANIICHNLALGRKVLFVAEKMAALNVVYRTNGENWFRSSMPRAYTATKPIKKQYLSNYDRLPQERSDSSLSESWVASVTELKQRRGHLNKYVTELHKKSDYGLSAREAYCTRDVFYKEQHKPIVRMADRIAKSSHQKLPRS